MHSEYIDAMVIDVGNWHDEKGVGPYVGDVWCDHPVFDAKMVWLAIGSLRSCARFCDEHVEWQRQQLNHVTDHRVQRIALHCEEMAELLDAMMRGDEVELLDGLADSLWVINGTAAQFDLPLGEAYDEVRRSNYSKLGARAQPGGSTRLRDKGANYFKPDMEAVILCHRSKRRALDVSAERRGT